MNYRARTYYSEAQKSGGGSISVNGPLKGFIDDGFVVGILFLTKTL